MTRFCFLLLTYLFCYTTMSAQLQNPKQIPFDWKTDTTRAEIPLGEIQVVLPRHSFPTIDFPSFLSKAEGLEAFYEYEPVLAVAINGQAKAYPLNMLTMHEISNDTLAGIPILPTYCPLCNASMVFDRRLEVDGSTRILEFEVSGMLRNSDMVMADQQTETWWQQLTGEGIVGELAGQTLEVLPSVVIAVSDFFERYPGGLILSPRSSDRPQRYGINPYEGYDSSDGKPYARYFDPNQLDDRLDPMERVVDVRGASGKYKVYPFSSLARKGVINDVYEDRPLVLFHKPGTVSVLDRKTISASRDIGSATVFERTLDGTVLTFKRKKDRFVDTNTNSSWDITGRCIEGQLAGRQLRPVVHSNHFAFAWLTFHPDSEIYR